MTTKTKTKPISLSKQIAFTAMCTAIICVLSPLSIPIATIPVSLGLFAVLFVCALTNYKTATLAVTCYIALGLIGLPVFANGVGGAQVLIGATGGYVVGYIPTAFITSLLLSKFENSKKLFAVMTFVSMIIGVAVTYLFGTIWFSILMNMNFTKALSICVIPYIPFDLLKVALAGAVCLIIRKQLKSIIN